MKLASIIREKFGIEQPNAMQQAVWASRASKLVILSPTGSGKTIAFGGALLKRLQPAGGYTQALILAPSRELTLQILR